jgi:23S rRNA (pseudouridine1915-N3)-methyltransferase
MKLILLNVGKTDESYLISGMQVYEKRLKHYCSFENTFVNVPPPSAKAPAAQVKQKEAEAILKKLKPDDYVVLLDENGRQFKSSGFAQWLNLQMIKGCKRLVFVTGGAFGFHESIMERAAESISLSQMTFPHQLVRLIFVEQLYRAFSILRNEPYHNE